MAESPHQSPRVKSEKDVFLLDKSIKEFKELRSQLHYAADYCETIFLKSKQKDQVVENTKEYLCRAVITVVDHLGSASANLEKIISQDKNIPNAELRLDSLSQRLLAWKQFSHQSAVADLCWNPHRPRHHSHYLLAELPNHGKSLCNTNDATVANYAEAKKCDEVFAGSLAVCSVKSDAIIPKWPKVQNTGFEFQKTRKPRGIKLLRASFQSRSDILSLIRGTKRTPRIY